MSTVTILPFDIYTLIYHYPKTSTPAVFMDIIDISIGRDCIKFQPLIKDRAWTEDFPAFALADHPVTLKRGRLVAVYQSDTLMVVTKRT